MKRVLCIVSSLDTGGAETFMLKVFRALPVTYKIDFIVSANKGHYECEVCKLGGKIYRVPLRTKIPIKTFHSIYRIVKDNQYQYVLKLSDTPIGLFDLMAARLGGAKRICVRSCNANSNESCLRRMINSIIRPIFNAFSDVKIAPSDLAANYTFGKKVVEKGEVVYLHNAVDLRYYRYNENARRRTRDELGISNTQILLGHIGRFNSQKNHTFLIRLFKCFLKKREDAVLLLIGEGEQKEEIKRMVKELKIEKSVMFLGVRSDIPSLLSSMDALLLPSLFEGMPNSVIEAQAVGIPCVVSDTITRQANITGLVHYVSLNDNIEEWVSCIENAIGTRRDDVSKDFVANDYTIESVTKKFIQIIFG